MPSEKLIGQEGPNNKKIGGVPTLHYFDFQSRGRGQVVRLMWEVCAESPLLFLAESLPHSSVLTSPFQDAGIAYKDVRYSFEEYPEYKKSRISELNPTATIPVVELNGRILTQSYAILRRFARQLGAYDGKTEEEKYWADVICDIASDCKLDLLWPLRCRLQRTQS